MSTGLSIAATDRPSRDWLDVHEDPAIPWPRWQPATEPLDPPRRYAWRVPGLAIAAPAVIEGRSATAVARALLAAARADGNITAWRQRLLIVLHELAPGTTFEEPAAGTWPTCGVVQRIAATVTLERRGPIVSRSTSGGMGSGGTVDSGARGAAL